MAIAFAQAHAKGIALLGRTKGTLEETASEVQQTTSTTDVFVATADITDQTQVQSAFTAMVEHYGVAPDVLVNNAGALVARGAMIDVDIEQLWKSFDVNTKGPLIVSQAFSRAARDSREPDALRTLINIPSGAAHLPFYPNGGPYAISKLASTKITEYLHYENPGWNVFNMQPGVVATELARKAGREAPDDPALPAGMAVWLSASPKARELSGLFMWANWDVDELLSKIEEIKRRGLLKMSLKGWAEESSDEDLVEIARSTLPKAGKQE